MPNSVCIHGVFISFFMITADFWVARQQLQPITGHYGSVWSSIVKIPVNNNGKFKLDAFRSTQSVKTGKNKNIDQILTRPRVRRNCSITCMPNMIYNALIIFPETPSTLWVTYIPINIYRKPQLTVTSSSVHHMSMPLFDCLTALVSRIWNSLHAYITSAPSVVTFQLELMTCLVRQSYQSL